MLKELINKIFFSKRNKRKEIYKELLEYFQSDIDIPGLCYALKIYYGKHNLISNRKHIKDFPELMKQKPDNAFDFWWTSYEKEPRIKALEAAIKLCN